MKLKGDSNVGAEKPMVPRAAWISTRS
jgi:hypothetical protein